MAIVGLSTTEPAPAASDFALFIDFEKGIERPQRIFQAMDGLISSFERLDKALAGALDPTIEPVLVLEDIEAGSLKVWLRDKLLKTEDQALYELDWRPMVGKYLLAAKWAFVEWVTDEEERQRPGSLADLRKRFIRLAGQTDLKKIPAYGAPTAAELIGSAEDMANALSKLDVRDRAEFLSEEGNKEFDLRLPWDSLQLADLAVRETIQTPPTPMILAVKRPDYLGEAQWEFRHGKRSIRAKIDDSEWLQSFQDRRVDVRPGDALRCLVRQEVRYGYDNELISEAFSVTEVQAVLENQYRQADMFGDEDT